MRRIYDAPVLAHFAQYDTMLFLVGPRQVGKTTLAKRVASTYAESLYLNWDVVNDRKKILSGQDFIETIFPSNQLRPQKPFIIFDEIHKYKKWKDFLKGFYDLYQHVYHILVTGSTRLDVLSGGGESLMGRYFVLRIHPVSLYESLMDATEDRTDTEIVLPVAKDLRNFDALFNHGGFPSPYLHQDIRYSRRWQNLKQKQLFYEDIQSLAQIHEVARLEVLAELLKHRTGQLLNRTPLAAHIQVTVQTLSRWLDTLERFYYCFFITPWSSNIARSLTKEPKVYLRDWSLVSDPGARFENFVACHLQKAVDWWNDHGMGNYALHFLRDKDKREVDFVITKNAKPWLLVEAKTSSNQSLNSALYHFQEMTQAPYALQVVKDLPAVEVSCFLEGKPWMVPASTFLSQLL